ncbi:MAG: hypothetical protein AAGJ46_08870 [Planctomycetota bacterium]
MHAIQLDDVLYKKISDQATAAGYRDVVTYVAALADDAAFDARCGLSDDALQTNAQRCDAIAGRMENGAEHDAREALAKLGEARGMHST